MKKLLFIAISVFYLSCSKDELPNKPIQSDIPIGIINDTNNGSDQDNTEDPVKKTPLQIYLSQCRNEKISETDNIFNYAMFVVILTDETDIVKSYQVTQGSKTISEAERNLIGDPKSKFVQHLNYLNENDLIKTNEGTWFDFSERGKMNGHPYQIVARQ